MKNNMIIRSSIIVKILIILSLTNTLMVTADEPLQNRIIFVNNINIMGPWDGTQEHPYQLINDGVLNAIDGDIVYVFSGEYYENIIIDKSITLSGENKNSTIIDGINGEFIIHTIKDGVTIEQFTIRNSGGFIGNSGIKFDSKYNKVRNCTIYRTKTGVYVNNTKNNEINNCTFHNNGDGIYLISSHRNEVAGCCFYNNAFGINIEDSYEINISDCYANTNSIGYIFENSSKIW